MSLIEHIREPMFYIDNDDFKLFHQQTWKAWRHKAFPIVYFAMKIDSSEKTEGRTRTKFDSKMFICNMPEHTFSPIGSLKSMASLFDSTYIKHITSN